MMSAAKTFFDRWFTLGGDDQRILAMEGLRGYAVLLIFFVHFFGALAKYLFQVDLDVLSWATAHDVRVKFCFFFQKSHYGVDLFFVISGFLIYRIITRPGPVFDYADFVRHRVRRIYPAFLVSLAAGAVVFSAWLHLLPFHWPDFLANLVFLNGCSQVSVIAYNPVTWTLFYEFAFYLLFPLALYFQRGRLLKNPLAFAVCAALVIGLLALIPGRYLRAAHFLSGAFLALSLPTLPSLARRIPDTLTAALYIGATYIMSTAGLPRYQYVALYLCASALLFIKVCFDDGWLHRLFCLRPLRYLGNISYSFYLMHAICIRLTFTGLEPRLLGWNSQVAHAAVLLIISFVSAVVVSALLFETVERRYFRAIPKS